MSRPLRVAFPLAAAALIALLASGCATALRPGSLGASQTGAGGSVHVHYEACSYGSGDEEQTVPCGKKPGKTKEDQEKFAEQFEELTANLEEQSLLAFAVPIGSSAPPTITAVGVGTAPTFTYSRSAEVAAAFAKFEREEGDSRPWPPAGTELVGYIGPYMHIRVEEWKWNIDAEFGLPVPADGSAFGGPFVVEQAEGFRIAGEVPGTEPGQEPTLVPAERPINCREEEPAGTSCQITEGVSAAVTDLRLGAPATVTAFPGGGATVAFPAAYGSSATPPAPYALVATTGVPKGTATPAAPSFTAPVDPGSHRAALTTAGVTVAVPKGAKPGSYPVTLTATGPAGRTATQGGTLKVISAKPKLGKIRQLRKKGTIQVAVGVPGAGTLTVSGKGVAKVKKKATKAKTLKVIVKAKGPKAKALAATGKAGVKPKFKFKPASGAAVTVPFALILKLGR